MEPDILRLHLEYSFWADSRLLDAAAALAPDQLEHDFVTADRSVLGTLRHVFRSEEIWLSRIAGTALEAQRECRMADLKTLWPPLEKRWRDWAAGLTDEGSRTLLRYSDSRGNRWEQPLWQLILHVVNHGTHHRGQVSGFLRALGHTPPAVDLTVFHRSRASAGSRNFHSGKDVSS